MGGWVGGLVGAGIKMGERVSGSHTPGLLGERKKKEQKKSCSKTGALKKREAGAFVGDTEL